MCRIQALPSVLFQNPSMVIGVLGKDGRNALFLVEQGCDIEKEAVIIQSKATFVRESLCSFIYPLYAACGL